MIEMVEGKPPYMNKDYSPEKVCKKILKNSKPKIKESVSANLQDFIKRCLHKKVSKRWSADELMRHVFIEENALEYTQLEPLMSTVIKELYSSDEESCDDGIDESDL